METDSTEDDDDDFCLRAEDMALGLKYEYSWMPSWMDPAGPAFLSVSLKETIGFAALVLQKFHIP